MKKIQLILFLLLTVALITGCRVDGNTVILKDLTPELSLLDYKLSSEEIKDDEDGSVKYVYTLAGSIINEGAEGHCRIEGIFGNKEYNYGPVKAQIGEITFSFEVTSIIPINGIGLRAYAISQEGNEKLQVDTMFD